MTSTNFPNIDQQSAGEKFSFVLEKEDSNWYIDSYANSEDDGFDKEEVSLKSNKLEVTNERLAKWEQNLQNIDELVSDFKNITLNKDKDKDSSSMKPAQYSGYNGIAASEYAQTWACHIILITSILMEMVEIVLTLHLKLSMQEDYLMVLVGNLTLMHGYG